MAWFKRRQGCFLWSCDYFSGAPVFLTESMLLLKFTCIFLKTPLRKPRCMELKKAIFFSIFSWLALVSNRTPLIPCPCNVLFTELQSGTTLDSLSALDHEISLKKHTCIGMYIPGGPKKTFQLWSCIANELLDRGSSNLGGLTRAPLGYFYNAPHWGGGGYFELPSDLPNYWADSKNSSGIWKPWKNCQGKTNFIDLGVTSDVTGQVKVKMFDISGLVTSASKIAMLSTNKVN